MGLHAALTVLLVLVASSAHALLIRLDFAGTVDVVSDPAGEFTGLIASGDPFSGQLVYDTDLVDTESSASWGRYLAASTSLVGTFGSFTETNGPYEVLLNVYDGRNVIAPNPALDDALSASVRPPSGSGTYSTLSVTLGDKTASAFGSDALPSSLDLADFDFARATLVCTSHINRICENYWFIQGEIDALSVEVVPEPSTITLLGGSLLAVGAARSRTRHGRRAIR